MTRWPLERPAWQAHAACRGHDPAEFFPEKGDNGPKVQAAKAVCAGCTVRAECLAHALARVEHWGVWGGLTLRERRALRRGMAEAS